MKKQYLVFVIMVLVMVLQCAYYALNLPDSVACHFDSTGQPDQYTSKSTYMTYCVAIYAIALASVLFGFFLLPAYLHKFPDSIVNLPNKAYWLAPERRDATFSYIHHELSWHGVATTTLLIAFMQLAFYAGQPDVQFFSIKAVFIMIAAYMIYAILWAIQFLLHFRKK